MAVSVHYFHCTDGADLIVDRQGREAREADGVLGRAREVAAEIMRAVPAFREWENWAVHVYDAQGEVAIVPFAEPPAAPEVSAQNAQSRNAGSTERPHAPSNRRRRLSARVSPVSTITSRGSRNPASSRPASSR